MSKHLIEVYTRKKTHKLLHLEGTSVLDSLLAFNFPAPHQCRLGDCGNCRATLISGAITPVQQPKYQVVNQNEFLTCCSKPVGDIKLKFHTEDEIFDVKINNDYEKALRKAEGIALKITDCDHLPQNIFIIKGKLKEPLENYSPGQYIQLTGDNFSKRSYSIAKIDRTLTRIELHIRNYADGLASEFFRSGALGNIVSSSGPYGQAIYKPEYKNAPVIAVCAGVGFAAVKSIIQAAINDNPSRQIDLVYFRRNEEDIYDRETIEGWQKSVAAFTYREIATRADHPAGRMYAAKAIPSNFMKIHDSVIFIAGSDSFVKDSQQAFEKLDGAESSTLLADSFVAAESVISGGSSNASNQKKLGFFSRLFSK